MTTNPSRPNIILIFCDQLRGDCIGADGNRIIQTPNIDWLAARGTHFRHAYAATPSCIPARASLWTGQNAWHTGILGMGYGQGHMPNDFPHTLAGELSNAGYHTHLVGVGHFNPPRASMGFQSGERRFGFGPDDDYVRWFMEQAPPGVTPIDHGVSGNSWVGRPWHTEERLHTTAWTTERAIHFLESCSPDKPFFLNISFQHPHSPYTPPEYYFNLYYNDETPPAVVGGWASIHDCPEDAVNVDAWRGRMTPKQIHRARSGYYGDVSFIDSQIGRLMIWIHRLRPELFQNTWFQFASDHGDMLGDHNLWRKTYAYEGSARVPLIIMPPPGNKEFCARKVDNVVSHMDIMPTVLEIAGLPCPATVDGSSMLPLMRGETVPWRPYLHGEHCTCYHREQEMQYLTDGHRKYIWFPRIDTEQLFDLVADPGECNDLSSDPARQSEITLWRERLVQELESRNCGWVRDGLPDCPSEEPLVSPWRDKRWRGES